MSDNSEFFQDSHPEIQTRNVMQEDFNWEVPVEAVPVPSEGNVYSVNSALHGRSILEIKAMTAQEEDILTSRALIRQGSVISHLIKSCLIDKSVNVDELLLGDKNALMVAIRVTGYGSRYSADVSCRSCGKGSNHDFDLASLEIRRLEIDPVAPGENLFHFRLPVTKKDIHFKFLTGKDESEISVMSERMKKMTDSSTDNMITTRLAYQIMSIDGITDKNKIGMFVKSMPAQDSRKLRTYIDQNEPGIDMRVQMNCQHCGTNSRVSLPLGSEFLWPTE